MTQDRQQPPFRASVVVLDVDGTLVDVVGAWRRGVEAAATRCSQLAGSTVTAQAISDARRALTADSAWRGRSASEVRAEAIRRVLAPLGVAEESATLDADAAFARARAEALVPYPDVRESLEALRSVGLTLAAASNGSLDLNELGLAGYFAATLFAPEVGMAKPDPGFFREAVRRAGGVVEAAVAVGDRLDNDYEPARAAGLQAVLLDRAGAVGDPSVFRIGSLTELPKLIEPVKRPGG